MIWQPPPRSSRWHAIGLRHPDAFATHGQAPYVGFVVNARTKVQDRHAPTDPRLLAVFIACQSGPPVEADRAITGATVIDVTTGEALPGRTVLIGGNRIAAVGATDELPVADGVEIVDADGMYPMPGL